MSKFEKAVARLKSRPKDFCWAELQHIMNHFGYEEIKGGGSRRKFINSRTNVSFSLHEPHPRPEIKMYALNIVIEHLKEEGYI